MKIIINDYEDYSEVIILNADGTNFRVFTFDDKKQATDFVSGWNCAKQFANFMIQSMPDEYERHDMRKR